MFGDCQFVTLQLLDLVLFLPFFVVRCLLPASIEVLNFCLRFVRQLQIIIELLIISKIKWYFMSFDWGTYMDSKFSKILAVHQVTCLKLCDLLGWPIFYTNTNRCYYCSKLIKLERLVSQLLIFEIQPN